MSGGNSKRNEYFIFLAGLALFCAAASVLRMIISHKTTYWFLIWNLFLAVIPYIITSVIKIKPALANIKLLFVFLLVLWILFFPNAPYIVTDLIYLRRHPEKMFWFDMFLFLLYSGAGFLFGFVSLFDMANILLSGFGRVQKHLIVSAFLFVVSFGIHLGRDLRWNSWDAFLFRKSFFIDIAERILHPAVYGRTWSFTILMGVFLNIIYYSILFIRSRVSGGGRSHCHYGNLTR